MTSSETSNKYRALNIKRMLFLFLAAALVYCNTFGNGYVYDDIHMVRDNVLVKRGVVAIPDIFTKPYHPGAANDFYRPLSLATFALERSFWGLVPVYDHVLNVLFFALIVVLLFRFIDVLFERRKNMVAFIAALLFALHPIHTEVVANVKSRDELLCCLFAFLALNLFIDYVRGDKWGYLIAGLASFFLSLISKETSVTLLAIIPLVFFFYRNENIKKNIVVTVLSVLTVAGYLWLRHTILGASGANNYSEVNFLDNILAAGNLSFGNRAGTTFYILGYYLRLLLVPYPLICDYSYRAIPFVDLADPLALLSVLVYVAMVGYSVVALVRKKKDPFAFAILFYLITLSLFSNLFFLISGAMAERFVFFSSVGYCMFIALVVDKLFIKNANENGAVWKNKPLILSCAVIVAFYSVLTVNRNRDWYDNITLFTTDIKKSPESSLLLSNLGAELSITISKKETDNQKKKEILLDANTYLSKAVAISDLNFHAHTQLGQNYFMLGLFDSAEVHDKRAIELSPTNIYAMNSYAGVFFARNDYKNALLICNKVLHIDPMNAEAYCNKGLCYYNMGKVDSAFYSWRKAIEVNPEYNPSYEDLARGFEFEGKADSAKKYELIARQNNPSFKL